MLKFKNSNSRVIFYILCFINLYFFYKEFVKDNFGLKDIILLLITNLIFIILLGPSCWNVYVFKSGVAFKNNFLFYKKRKYKFRYEDIKEIKITHGKYGPYIMVKRDKWKKKFYSIGVKQTKIFVSEMKKRGVKVIDDNEMENPFFQDLFPMKDKDKRWTPR